jgi:hypothetical protein
MRDREVEYSRLKQMSADLRLANAMIRDVSEKNFRAGQRKELVEYGAANAWTKELSQPIMGGNMLKRIADRQINNR